MLIYRCSELLPQCVAKTFPYFSAFKKMCNKRKIIWTKIEQYSFDKFRHIVSRDDLLTYPYFNE